MVKRTTTENTKQHSPLDNISEDVTKSRMDVSNILPTPIEEGNDTYKILKNLGLPVKPEDCVFKLCDQPINEFGVAIDYPLGVEQFSEGMFAKIGRAMVTGLTIQYNRMLANPTDTVKDTKAAKDPVTGKPCWDGKTYKKVPSKAAKDWNASSRAVLKALNPDLNSHAWMLYHSIQEKKEADIKQATIIAQAAKDEQIRVLKAEIDQKNKVLGAVLSKLGIDVDKL